MEVLGTNSELLQPSTVITAECGEFRIILNSILYGSVSDLIPRGERSWEGVRFTCLRKPTYTSSSFWWVIFFIAALETGWCKTGTWSLKKNVSRWETENFTSYRRLHSSPGGIFASSFAYHLLILLGTLLELEVGYWDFSSCVVLGLFFFLFVSLSSFMQIHCHV